MVNTTSNPGHINSLTKELPVIFRPALANEPDTPT